MSAETVSLGTVEAVGFDLDGTLFDHRGAATRRFYGEALGLREIQKPPSLIGRGGCWFRAYDGDVVVAEIHLGSTIRSSLLGNRVEVMTPAAQQQRACC